jgi:streptomycin 6-kinase
MNDATDLRHRVQDRLRAWDVIGEHCVDTEGSVLVFGQRHNESVVLKVARRQNDEWWSGAILHSFGGRGAVRALDHVDGAVLLERLRPGTSLATSVGSGNDDEVTRVLADVIGRMSPSAPPATTPTVEEWGRGFTSYAASGDGQIPASLLESAQHVYTALSASQSRRRLLHGDLHHHNVLRDSERGWLAVDPKGVIGELEYEVGAAFRNPYGQPELFTAPAIIRRRAERFTRELSLDVGRVLGWVFAQAVLAAVWAIEDGGVVQRDSAWLTLAQVTHQMLNSDA